MCFWIECTGTAVAQTHCIHLSATRPHLRQKDRADERRRRFHPQPAVHQQQWSAFIYHRKKNVSFHALLFAARGLSFNLSHLFAAESAEGGGLRAKPTMADKSPWFTQTTHTPSERCLRPSRSTLQKAKRARRLTRARRKTSPHSHCRTSPQRKRGRANLTPSAAWPLTWLTYSHRPEKHRFIRTVKKKKSPCSLCV